jgi:FecR protein
MKMNKIVIGFWILLAGMGLTVVTVSTATAQDDYDPPGRVARMNFAQGSVSFQPGGEGDWVDAVPNRPLTSGDNLWTDQGSRAELHVGSTALRLGPETSLTFLDLDDNTTQLRLSQGSLIFRVRHLDDNDLFEVDTPNLAYTLQRTGQYRIDVSPDGNQTTLTVWNGRGEVTGGGYSYTVVAGQEARFYGTDQLRYDIGQIPPNDDFDTWGLDRDRREDRVESANYVSPEITGYEDLDDYGRWTYVADYGTVWIPSGIASDWAPYRNGHWVFIEPWGWTWVEDEPWGFAPFHYGRWAYAESRWCWVPGPVVVRPVYAPALVAWVGAAPGVAVVPGGGIGWFPLGPGEVYVPPYRVSRVYVNNVNITNTRVNVTQVTNVYNVYQSNSNVRNIRYLNQRVNSAVTVVSRDTFVNARPVARNVVRVDTRQIVEAPVVHQIPVAPVRASVIGAGAPARVRPPAAVVNRQVVATQRPAPVRAPFEQRQAAMNVRTEQRAPQPQPLPERGNQGARSNQPMPPPHGTAMPQQPVAPPHGTAMPQENTPPHGTAMPAEPAARTGNENARPQAARPEVPHPPARAEQPQPASRETEPNPGSGQRPMPRQVPENDRPQQGWQHPLARPAPPEREKTAEQRQDEENKFRNWQQQREQAPRPAQAQRQEAPRPPQPNRPPERQRPPQPQNRPQPKPPQPPGTI